ncbi:MAG: hypothetical protein IKU39_01570 [Lachnospiraceae bacterium]|nr:hypothetical protein [Lachnospiraceae bacterium]
MKNYDELTNDLLERRDRYVADQKKKRKRVMGVATSLCCFCLVALLGFGMWQGGMFNTTPPDQTLEDALYPGIKDNFDESKGESPDNPSANNKIVINTINGISADRMNINIAVDDFVKMTREEMIEYYGVDYIPDVPADIKPWEDERSGIYKRDGGTGEVYWDTDILNYSNEDFTRSVHVEVDKGSYVLQDYLYFKGTEEKSVINNVDVLIGLTENGYYYSEFMYNGVGFLIDAEGVTEDEFVAIIASIIQ